MNHWQQRQKNVLATIFLAAVMFSTSSIAQNSSSEDTPLPDWLRAPYLNVVMSVNDESAMREFYGDVLGLEPLSDLLLSPRRGRPAAVTMVRFKLGRSQIKMLLHNQDPPPGASPQRADGEKPPPIPERSPGGRATANGLRLLSFPTDDGKSLAARIQDWNGTTVEWLSESTYKVAWVKDPDDNEIELRWYQTGSPELSQLELALTVNDLERSLTHYGKILALPPLSTVERAGFNGKTYQFQVGDSILRVWSPGKKLPVDTGWTKNGFGLRYVQFIVKDAYALHDHLIESGAGIAQTPTPLGGGATLLFAKDPDGVINECVGPAKKE